MFKFGDIVRIKTTGETGIVVSDAHGETRPLIAYEVRVPKINKEGAVEHVEGQPFFEVELETTEAKLTRELEDIVREQQIRIEAKERFDKWSEKRSGSVIQVPENARVN